VVGPSVEVEIGMVEFVVHCVAQRAAGSPVNIYVHKACWVGGGGWTYC
jgi:hypothetical protein